LPKLLDGGVEPVLEVDEGVSGPKPLPDLLASDDFARATEK
jgi:hypothetical protein